MKKEIILPYIELSIRLRYIQETGRSYPDILAKKIMEKTMKYIKNGKRKNRKKRNRKEIYKIERRKSRNKRNRKTLIKNRKKTYLGRRYM